MKDQEILALYFRRSEEAIQASMDSYGSYCRAVAAGILEDPEDVEEAVADTWLRAWNAIPPAKPDSLRLYLGRITRNLSLSLWRKNNAQRRGGGQVLLALEELGECVSRQDTPEALWDTRELASALSAFLRQLPEKQRRIFLRRYFYLEEIAVIAKSLGTKEVNIRMILSRLRKKLKEYLLQEGYEL